MKVSREQVEKAERFQRMHQGGEILVLLNAWDAASARVFQGTGSKAVGTTSMGIAAAAGFPDVETIPLDDMIVAVRRIVEAVEVPVNADMEAGYGSSLEEVITSIRRAVECGAVGINIEDGTGDPNAPLLDPARFSERVSAIREATTSDGIPLVINARTDVFLARVGSLEERLKDAIARGNRYREAGADCVFVPGGLGRETIRTLVREIDAPLNVVANPAISVPVVPTVGELRSLGVARVSVGSGAMRAMLAFTRRMAEEVLTDGVYDRMIRELAGNAPEAYEMAIGKRR